MQHTDSEHSISNSRRSFLSATGAIATTSLAGCANMIEWQSPYAPPIVEDRPDAVYTPGHVEEMAMIGMKTAGPYGCALSYSYPHRFWLVTGTRTERVSIDSEDSIHLMATVWNRETGIVLPDASPNVSITAGGESVTSLNPWSMLSQPMGLHFGDNVVLPSEGPYEIEVGIAPPSLPRSEAMPEGPGERRSCSFSYDFDLGTRDDLEITEFPDTKGDPGAVPAMDMSMVPTSMVPETDALPGNPLGTGESGDAVFVATAIDDATRFGGSAEETYLAVSPRTRYNRFGLPFMGLRATIDRGGTTVYDDSLRAALDPDLSVHYGALVDGIEAGDTLAITVETPPQLSRHEGYETAFLSMPPVEIDV